MKKNHLKNSLPINGKPHVAAGSMKANKTRYLTLLQNGLVENHNLLVEVRRTLASQMLRVEVRGAMGDQMDGLEMFTSVPHLREILTRSAAIAFDIIERMEESK